MLGRSAIVHLPNSVESSPGIGILDLRIEWVEKMAIPMRSTRGGRRVKFGIRNGGGGCCVGPIMVNDRSTSLAMSSIWVV